MNLKSVLKYRKLWKNQKHKNKRLIKKINRLTRNITEDLKLDITNDEIRKLKNEVNNQQEIIKKLELECQKYFDWFMNEVQNESK